MDNYQLKKLLIEKFGDAILEVQDEDKLLTINLISQKLFEIIQFLKEDSQTQFEFLTDICGIHYPGATKGELGIVYHLHNLRQNKRIRVKTFVTKENPVVQSLTSLFKAANWMERETYDFYGIRFAGHPKLIRILNVEYLDFFPLRKEYPLEDPTREDKDDRFFGR